MDEHEGRITYLVEHVGLDVEEAQARLGDDDLWLLPAEQRFAPRSEQDIEDLRRAGDVVSDLALFVGSNTECSEVVTALLWDASARARELARRGDSRLSTE